MRWHAWPRFQSPTWIRRIFTSELANPQTSTVTSSEFHRPVSLSPQSAFRDLIGRGRNVVLQDRTGGSRPCPKKLLHLRWALSPATSHAQSVRSVGGSNSYRSTPLLWARVTFVTFGCANPANTSSVQQSNSSGWQPKPVVRNVLRDMPLGVSQARCLSCLAAFDASCIVVQPVSSCGCRRS